MLRQAWGVDTPRPYQVEMVFHLAFRKVHVHLIQKYGEGKSLVLLGMATLLCGVTVCMVPLLGLGSDRVNKSKRPSAGVGAYHCDEFRGSDFNKFQYAL